MSQGRPSKRRGTVPPVDTPANPETLNESEDGSSGTGSSGNSRHNSSCAGPAVATRRSESIRLPDTILAIIFELLPAMEVRTFFWRSALRFFWMGSRADCTSPVPDATRAVPDCAAGVYTLESGVCRIGAGVLAVVRVGGMGSHHEAQRRVLRPLLETLSRGKCRATLPLLCGFQPDHTTVDRRALLKRLQGSVG